MDFTLSFETAVIASLFASLISLYYLLWIPYTNKNIRNPKPLPEAEGAWPVIGHFYLFNGSKLPHIVLGSMAEKYGPIFGIKLGNQKAMIVSDWKTAKECYSANDKVFLNRPKAISTEIIGYNYAMFGLGPYGPYWQKMRKIVTQELLCVHRIEMFEHLRIAEIQESMKDMYDFWLQNKSGKNNMVKFEMKQWLGCLTMNMLLKMLVGQRYKWNDKESIQFLKPIRSAAELFGRFVLGDSVSYLRWLDWGGYEKAMRSTAKELDSILDEWLQEHKRNRKSEDEQHDFMDLMLSSFDGATSQDFEGFDTDTVIKSTLLALLSGAADTTRVILTWAVSLLISNPRVLKKARDELNNHVGRDRQVAESDIKNLVYLQAIVKECMRLHPAGQLLAPRESIEDCVIGGYNIPKGTRLIINLSKVQRDPQVWPNPNEFQPERFLTSHQNVDIKGNNYELLPFGSGRRMCPGIFLGLRVMQLALASFIHGFEFEKPSDEVDDMSETIGLTNFKANQFEILLKPTMAIKK